MYPHGGLKIGKYEMLAEGGAGGVRSTIHPNTEFSPEGF